MSAAKNFQFQPVGVNSVKIESPVRVTISIAGNASTHGIDIFIVLIGVAALVLAIAAIVWVYRKPGDRSPSRLEQARNASNHDKDHL